MWQQIEGGRPMVSNFNVRASVSYQSQASSDSYVRCQVEVTSQTFDELSALLDSLIEFGFDTLHARVLDVRVVHPDTHQSVLQR